jgi:hypothetical protein
MQKIIAVAFASIFGFSSIVAEAMPITALDGNANPTITKVAQGCGPGCHRGPYGHCRRLFTCPPGWHAGPMARYVFAIIVDFDSRRGGRPHTAFSFDCSIPDFGLCSRRAVLTTGV